MNKQSPDRASATDLMSRLHDMPEEKRKYAIRSLPTHLVDAKQTKRVTDLLTDLDFIQAKSALMNVRDLILDYELADRQCDDLNDIFPQWGEWKYFVTNVSNDIELYLGQYPQIVFQQAYNSSKKGFVARAAQEWLRLGKHPKGFWFERVNRPEYMPINPSLFVLEGHLKPVYQIVLSQDKRRAISGSADGTLRIWDTTTGACLNTCTGHQSAVLAIHPTTDGRIISASWDHTIRIWSIETGECLNILTGHSAPVCYVSTLGDSTIYSTSFDGTIRLWNIDSGGCIQELRGHGGPVNHAIVHGSPASMASASDDGMVRIWNIENGSQKVLTGHQDAVLYLTETPDGRLLSCSADGTIIEWNTKREAFIRIFRGHRGPVSGICMLAKDRLVSWAFDNTIRIWSLETGKCIKVITEHKGPVTNVAVLPQVFITASQDGMLRIWDATTYELRGVLTGHRFWVNAVAADSAGTCISGSSDFTVRIWNWAKATPTKYEQEGESALTAKNTTSTKTPYVAIIDHSTAISTIDGEEFQKWDLISGACASIPGRNVKMEEKFWEGVRQQATAGFYLGIPASEPNFVPSIATVTSEKGKRAEGVGCFRVRIQENGMFTRETHGLAIYPLQCHGIATVYGFNRTLAFEARTRKAHVLLLKFGDREWTLPGMK